MERELLRTKVTRVFANKSPSFLVSSCRQFNLFKVVEILLTIVIHIHIDLAWVIVRFSNCKQLHRMFLYPLS